MKSLRIRRKSVIFYPISHHHDSTLNSYTVLSELLYRSQEIIGFDRTVYIERWVPGSQPVTNVSQSLSGLHNDNVELYKLESSVPKLGVKSECNLL